MEWYALLLLERQVICLQFAPRVTTVTAPRVRVTTVTILMWTQNAFLPLTCAVIGVSPLTYGVIVGVTAGTASAGSLLVPRLLELIAPSVLLRRALLMFTIFVASFGLLQSLARPETAVLFSAIAITL